MVRIRAMDSTRIDYTASWETDGGFPSRATLAERKAVMEAPEWEVRERWFFADVTLVAEGGSIRFSKTPVIDFMLAFGYSLRILAADRSAKFHVSGGGPALLLERNGGTVSIRGRSGFNVIIEYVDLAAACLIFQRRFIDEVTFKFPDLLLNDLIERLFRGAGLREIGRDHSLRHSGARKLKNEIFRGRSVGVAVGLTLNLTPKIRATLENLLTTAGRLEDDARIIEHFQNDLFGDLEEFRVTVYEPLRDKRSVKTGPGRNYALDLQDAGLVFDVIKGIAEGWSGGTPWKAMRPAERSAVDRFLAELGQPRV
jgi:hypothetical protein